MTNEDEAVGADRDRTHTHSTAPSAMRRAYERGLFCVVFARAQENRCAILSRKLLSRTVLPLELFRDNLCICLSIMPYKIYDVA